MGGGDAIGEHVATGLISIGLFRESVISLPIGIDPLRLLEALHTEKRSSPGELLARHQPNQGLEVQQLLEQEGQPCHSEVTPWGHRQFHSCFAAGRTSSDEQLTPDHRHGAGNACGRHSGSRWG